MFELHFRIDKSSRDVALGSGSRAGRPLHREVIADWRFELPTG